MMLAEAMTSGADPDAISCMFTKAFSWLMKSRADSAAWAIAFTVNTWAATIQSARIAVYEGVHKLFSDYKNEIGYAQWLEKADKLTDEDGHKKFRFRVNRLLTYIGCKDEKFRVDTKDVGSILKRVMWCAAFVSALVIVFQWYYNYTLAVLLPYPVFCIWHSLRGRWAMGWVWWLKQRAENSLSDIEKHCGKPDDEPPSMDELKKKLSDKAG